MTIPKKTKVGEIFKLRFANKQDEIVEIDGNIDVNRLTLALTNSTSYPDPLFKHLGGNQFKIFYNTRIPANSPYEYKFTEHGTQAQAEVVSWWSKLKPASKKVLKWVFITVLTTVLGGGLIFADKKYNEGKFGHWWRSVSVFGVADAIEEVEGAVFTNDHVVYQMPDFLEVQENFNEDRVDEGRQALSFKDMYWYTGNGVFALRKLVRDEKGIAKVNKSIAETACEQLGGELPTRAELDEVLRGRVSRLTDFVLPIEAERSVAEWTQTQSPDDNDFYFAYMKGEDKPPKYAESHAGEYYAEEDDSKLAFRCIMSARTFLPAE